MVTVTGVELSQRDPYNTMPSRSIFDPPNEAEDEELSEDECWGTVASSQGDTLTTRDTYSTGFGSPGRRRLRHKHPASLNEVELRIQLWDAYRLVRIILGTPIKSFSLRGKTILQSIRKVAEMKLELIRLEKELRMAKVRAKQPRYHTMDSDDTLETPQTQQGGSKTLHEHIQAHVQSPTMISPDRAHERNNRCLTTPPRGKPTALSSPFDQKFDLMQTKYEQLTVTHDQTMKALQSQLSAIKTQLESTSLENKESETEDSESKKSSIKNARGPFKGWNMVKRRRKPINRAEDTMQAVAAVAKSHCIQDQTPEELQLRMVLAKPSNAIRAKRAKELTPADERKKLLHMVEQLMAEVETSSQETQLQFEALQQQLEAHQSGEMRSPFSLALSKDSDVQTQEQFQQRLQTTRVLHILELETCKSKHIQQVVDLSGQLDAYQHQVDKQNTELQKWQKKYNHLEEMAVTPEEAKDVLRDLETLPLDATPEEHGRVHAKVVRVLQRMAQLQTRQQREQRLMQMTRQLAQTKEAESQSQLEDLMLQHELLTEDTQVPPEVWAKQMGEQRRAFEREMREIYKREERRMRDMEIMEAQLTDLAFLAVEIEDLEKECRDANDEFSKKLAMAKKCVSSATPAIASLRSQVDQLLSEHRDVVQGLEASWNGANTIHTLQGRLNDLTSDSPELLLQRRDEQLREAHDRLATSEARIRELEALQKREA